MPLTFSDKDSDGENSNKNNNNKINPMKLLDLTHSKQESS